MDPNPNSGSPWTRLSWDLTDLILSLLPIRSIIRSGSVCRHWRSVIADPSFRARSTRNPWFFLHGQNNVYRKQDQAFGYDPDSDSWIRLPARSLDPDLFSGAGGLSFSCGFGSGSGSETRFSYAPLPAGPRTDAPPLSFSRLNPLVGVMDDGSFVVVGGARFIGGLVDIEDRLATELYDPSPRGGSAAAWVLCPPLPPAFRSGGSSSHWLSSCVLPARRLFVVLGTYSGLTSALDVSSRKWAQVRPLAPPGFPILLSFLVACGDTLVLAALCSVPGGGGGGGCVFRLWEVDYDTLAVTEIGVMPRDLMDCVFDSDFASLRCVGVDGLLYVFNEDNHRGYPACLCRIRGAGGSSRWRKVPPLPGPINRFHKVVAFASPVSSSSSSFLSLFASVAAGGD